MSDTSGPTSQTPLAYYDPDTSSLRTSQDTFPWASMSSSLTLPRSGSMRNGRCYEHRTSAPATAAHASSSLPTPTAWLGRREAHSKGDPARWTNPERSNELSDFVAWLLPTPSAANPNDGEDLENWERRRLEQKERHGNGNGFGTPLAIAVRLMPTPNACDFKGATTPEAAKEWDQRGTNLPEAVRKLRRLPTPTSRDHKGQNQRGDQSCLPGALTHLQSPDTQPSSDDQPLTQPMLGDD